LYRFSVIPFFGHSHTSRTRIILMFISFSKYIILLTRRQSR
jgi:hypothetical protein